MSDEIEVAVSDQEGLDIFKAAFDQAEAEGSGELTCYTKGYLALEKAGYSEQKGVWKKQQKNGLFKDLLSFLRNPPNQMDTAEALELLVKLDDEDGGSGKNFTMKSKVVKMDEDQHLVYGWASVVEENGNPVTDHHGDLIEPDELTKAAHEFVSEYRKAKVMHNGASIGEIVESIVFSHDIQKALGINLNKVGWFIGMKVHDDEVWKSFKSGELEMFSIGGHGEREEI